MVVQSAVQRFVVVALAPDSFLLPLCAHGPCVKRNWPCLHPLEATSHSHAPGGRCQHGAGGPDAAWVVTGLAAVAAVCIECGVTRALSVPVVPSLISGALADFRHRFPGDEDGDFEASAARAMSSARL